MRIFCNRIFRHFFMLFCAVLPAGCSMLMSPATARLTDNLSQAILNNNDPATVEAGAPAYLLMTDSLLNSDADNESLLRAAATLYAVYADVFVRDKNRARIMTDKSLKYALHALCVHSSGACSLREENFQTFEQRIARMNAEDVPFLYTLGSAWAGWIQAHRDDWNAVAEISRVETIMRQVTKLNETYQDGSAYLYLGALATFLPPALGGKPDEGRKYFDRAVELSGNKNLMAKVVYARQYARLVFDRPLHDRLLQEVMKADPDVPGYVLSNTLAQQQAKELSDSAEDYF